MNTSTIATIITVVCELILGFFLVYLLGLFLRKRMDYFNVIFLKFFLSIMVVCSIWVGNTRYFLSNIADILNNKEKETFYDKVASKTLFWTDLYKEEKIRKNTKDSVWMAWTNYGNQWDKLFIEQKKTMYGSIEYNSIGRQMDSVHVLQDSALAVYDRLHY